MAKDKLITIRIESEKREDFTKWSKDRNLDASVFLYGVIDACLDGRIDEGILNERVDNEELDKRIDERFLKLENKLDISIDNRLDRRVSEVVEKAIVPYQKEVADFNKAFDSLGSTVHDHDRMLSKPVASKEDLNNAIATLQTEIDQLKKL